MNLNNMPMGRKLWLVVLGSLLAVLAVSAVSQWRTHDVMMQSLTTVKEREAVITLALKWRL